MENNTPGLKTGKVHIYAGNGKGKTTAAVGLAVRAAGYGLRVLFIQFLKFGDSSELNILRKLPQIKVLSGMPTQKFVFRMNDQEKNQTKICSQNYFEQAKKLAEENQVDLIIFDEILDAIGTGMLVEQELIDFIQKKSSKIELVITGRNPSQDLIELADYYSEISAIKHPYETENLIGRKGIEF